ncbi:MAG: peptidoglycan-associated lipoprotein Pal [Thermodesulfobacteriota bacterium]
MKKGTLIFLGVIFLSSIFNFSCSQKVMRTEETPFTTSRQETQKDTRLEPKAVTPSPPSPATAPAIEKQEKDKPLKEETLGAQPSAPPALKEEKEEIKRGKEARQIAPIGTELKSIFFDFDQAVIREDQKEVMLQNAQWLKAHPQVRVRIEGNCDERGTAEYNLALGQRRAEAVKEFLEGLGIAPKRMQTISYGFERPLDPGHNEEAWAKNRRVDFTILK